MTSLLIQLPWPAPELWPNRNNLHWSVRGRESAQAKVDGRNATLDALQGRGPVQFADGPIRLAITFFPPNLRRRDLDNMQAAMKHYLDGIALALEVDDSRFVPHSVASDRPAPRGHVTVEVSQ